MNWSRCDRPVPTEKRENRENAGNAEERKPRKYEAREDINGKRPQGLYCGREEKNGEQTDSEE